MLLFPKLNQTRQTLHRIRPPSLQLHLFIWQKVACEHNPAMMAVNVIEERTWEGRNIISRRQGCLFNTQTLDKTKQNTSSFRIIFVHWYIGLYVWDRMREKGLRLQPLFSLFYFIYSTSPAITYGMLTQHLVPLLSCSSSNKVSWSLLKFSQSMI